MAEECRTNRKPIGQAESDRVEWSHSGPSEGITCFPMDRLFGNQMLQSVLLERRFLRLPLALGLAGAIGACRGEPEESTELPVAPPESPLVMLTPTEYNNSVRELLGMPSDGEDWPSPASAGSSASQAWPWFFPPEVGMEGFEGIAAGQASSPYRLEQVYGAASHFSNYALHSSTFFVCDTWDGLDDPEQKSCGWSSIARFAQRAWRRPLTDSERNRLQSFWESSWDGGTPDEAVKLLVSGILQSPQFLYRLEHGRPAGQVGSALPLDDWEMASRLSYFLWDSMPDADLFRAASRGALRTRRQVEEQAWRMLGDDQARDAVVHFHNQWLGTTDMNLVSPARRVYGPLHYGISPDPSLSGSDETPEDFDWPNILLPLRKSMEMETRLFVERTVFDGGGGFTDLLTDNHGYMSDLTAPLYGDGAVELSGETVTVRADYGDSITLYPAEFHAEQRAGVLTLPSVLALLAHPVHPAPILRGKFVLGQLACQSLGAPPPGAEGEAPPDTLEAESTNRERTEAATSAPSCAVCHDAINPPGFAFESYDAMGGWRTTDNGQPVDTSGQLSLIGGESLSFSSASELAAQLAESDRVRDCYTLKWARYATGYPLDWEDEGVSELQSSFRRNDDIQQLLVTIAGSSLFRYRAAGGAQ
jgi:hypothetical protein